MIISVLLTLVEKLLPKLAELRDGGNITKETQASIRARYEKLAANMDEEFGGDHWKVRPNPEPETPDSRSNRSTETAGTVVKNKAKGDSGD